MLLYTNIYFFGVCFVFHSKKCVFIIFMSIFDKVSNFRNRILVKWKPKLVIKIVSGTVWPSSTLEFEIEADANLLGKRGSIKVNKQGYYKRVVINAGSKTKCKNTILCRCLSTHSHFSFLLCEKYGGWRKQTTESIRCFKSGNKV